MNSARCSVLFKSKQPRNKVSSRGDNKWFPCGSVQSAGAGCGAREGSMLGMQVALLES